MRSSRDAAPGRTPRRSFRAAALRDEMQAPRVPPPPRPPVAPRPASGGAPLREARRRSRQRARGRRRSLVLEEHLREPVSARRAPLPRPPPARARIHPGRGPVLEPRLEQVVETAPPRPRSGARGRAASSRRVATASVGGPWARRAPPPRTTRPADPWSPRPARTGRRHRGQRLLSGPEGRQASTTPSRGTTPGSRGGVWAAPDIARSALATRRRCSRAGPRAARPGARASHRGRAHPRASSATRDSGASSNARPRSRRARRGQEPARGGRAHHRPPRSAGRGRPPLFVALPCSRGLDSSRARPGRSRSSAAGLPPS